MNACDFCINPTNCEVFILMAFMFGITAGYTIGSILAWAKKEAKEQGGEKKK